jgi:iron complex outermembrane receptor protein
MPVMALFLGCVPIAGYAQELQGLEEVIVTSRKRAESLQDTPISVTALTADDLQARMIGRVSDIAAATPNLVFDTSSPISGTSASASIFIRGIGQTDFLLTTDPGVGVYLDDVYIARSIGSVLDLVDIERIEVLRGPQGTLFGRNTIGGAISITSKKPSATAESRISATTGSYDRLDARAMASGPLTSTLFGSVSLARFGREGHIDRPLLGDATGEQDGWAGRTALRWMPADAFELNLSLDASLRNENSCCEELVALAPAGLLTAFHNAVIAPATGQPPASEALLAGEFVDNATDDVPADIRIHGVAVDAEWRINDSLSLKSITSYRELESELGTDADHSPILLITTRDVYDARQFSQELQLRGSAFADRMSWIGGAYYFREKGRNIDDVDFSALHFVNGGRAENESLALFGQGTLALSERLDLTAGLRWTRDEKTFTPEDNVVIENRTLGTPFAAIFPPSLLNSDFSATPPVIVPLLPGTPLIPPGITARQEVQDATPYLSLAYDWSEEVMSYISYSEGFKSGGFVQRTFPDRATVPTFDPEYVAVVEAGLKATAFDRRLRLNAAVFHTDYSDVQIIVFQNGTPLTQNAAGAKIRGFELEVVALPLSAMKVELGIGYLDAQYTAIDPGVVTEVSTASDLVDTPRWSLSTGLSYSVSVANRFTLTPRIDWSYRARHANDARNTPELIQDGYHLLNASLMLEGAAGKWTAQLFGTNILDERYLITGVGAPDFQGFITAAYGRPAEWGLTVTRQF